MTKRYVLYPGFVISRADGDRHFITAPKLAQLYQVSLEECVVWSHDQPDRNYGLDVTGLIPLSPRSDGNYTRRGGEAGEEQHG